MGFSEGFPATAFTVKKGFQEGFSEGDLGRDFQKVPRRPLAEYDPFVVRPI